jgi:hypothetical protein
MHAPDAVSPAQSGSSPARLLEIVDNEKASAGIDIVKLRAVNYPTFQP